MPRTPEPEVMDDPKAAEAYAEADFSESNQAFVDNFIKAFPECSGKRVLDLGCGPADIPIRLAQADSKISITAVDASKAMIELAQKAILKSGVAARVLLHQGRLPGLMLQTDGFDAVVSNSILHHIPDPADFWYEVKRLGKRGAGVWVLDLARPDSPDDAQAIVETYSADEHQLLKDDFYNSLLAAYTIDEVNAQLKEAELHETLEAVMVSDRHWAVAGRLPLDV
ncbi:MAG: SAM-dependent methyltransferase [Elusimicrobia bacterium]|nr:MAG: SAM-dependent methyltransferase [Elusimicrobiota bacterium]